MTIEEKDEIYIAYKKICDVRNTLQIIRDELTKSNGSLNNEIIAGSLNLTIDSINHIQELLNDV